MFIGQDCAYVVVGQPVAVRIGFYLACWRVEQVQPTLRAQPKPPVGSFVDGHDVAKWCGSISFIAKGYETAVLRIELHQPFFRSYPYFAVASLHNAVGDDALSE